MTSRQRRAVLVGLLVPALLALAACSSDEGGSATTTPSPSSATTEPVGEPLDEYADYESVSYDDPAHWVCRPDIDDDPCDDDLDATAIGADGTLTVEPFEGAADAPIDCFYLYPTISRDPTAASDWDWAEDQEGFVTRNQAARLQSECRLFAPAYRQVTASALGGAPNNEGTGPDPYADVLDAFQTYLAQDNDGRGFVLVGHSQGSLWLRQLLIQEIEPDPELRDLLVGAYLAGTELRVPEGKVVGGDLQEIPLCAAAGEVGCIATWSSWRADKGPTTGRATPRGVTGCVHPGLAGGSDPALDPYFEASAGAAIGTGSDGKGGGSWIEGSDPPEITTPFVRLPDLVSGQCEAGPAGEYLAVAIDPAPNDVRADDLPAFRLRGGDLHLLDVNLAMGSVVSSVAAQAEAYAADHGGD